MLLEVPLSLLEDENHYCDLLKRYCHLIPGAWRGEWLTPRLRGANVVSVPFQCVDTHPGLLRYQVRREGGGTLKFTPKEETWMNFYTQQHNH
jgi:hypothetical protein